MKLLPMDIENRVDCDTEHALQYCQMESTLLYSISIDHESQRNLKGVEEAALLLAQFLARSRRADSVACVNR